MTRRTKAQYPALARSPWLRILAAALIVAAGLGTPTAARASSSASRVPVQEEERSAEEERSSVAASPQPCDRWRSSRPSHTGSGRSSDADPHHPSRGAGRSARLGSLWVAGRGSLEPRVPIPPPFHHWVRSQTW